MVVEMEAARLTDDTNLCRLADPRLRPREMIRRWSVVSDRNSTATAFDFRHGARWELTLHGPDGTDHKNEYFAVEIAEPERIVISHLVGLVAPFRREHKPLGVDPVTVCGIASDRAQVRYT